ncbi:hypothetical protein OSTOST_15708, partial [Ostertagia ostertagi]
MTFLPIFVIPMLAFGGFFITYESIPGYFMWLSALSYFKYSYEALAINEWETIDVIPGCQNHTFKYRQCPTSGAQVLEQKIHFSHAKPWRLLLACLCFFCIEGISARYPKRFEIDLDAPPSQRWNEVVKYHRDDIPGFIKAA